MMTLTDRAATQLAQLLASRSTGAQSGLRLAVRRGGCAGWQYEMKVGEPESDDAIVEQGGARLIIAADSVEKLRGCEVDYSDDLTDAGFKIHNPNASRSCGCGTSFETPDEPAPEADLSVENCGNS
ncbi:MAG TPA: iron-sulfur cluster assembly accessory protein [Luteolibacter sp.]|nr:iron-sulfur cluster assembly accessory protein [Luteolibacter sp.]